MTVHSASAQIWLTCWGGLMDAGTAPVSQSKSTKQADRWSERTQEPLRALRTIITGKSLSPVIFPVVVSPESAHL